MCVFLKVNLFKMSGGGNNNEMETRITHSLKAARGGGREDEARVLISENVPDLTTKREGGQNPCGREQSEGLVCTPAAGAAVKVFGLRK